MKISSLMLSRRQVQVRNLLRGSLTEFCQTLNAEGLKEEFPEGQWTFLSYANLWAESRNYEGSIMMTMEPEKRMHVYNVIQAYNRLMERHHNKSM